jgi:hypothetical protein
MLGDPVILFVGLFFLGLAGLVLAGVHALWRMARWLFGAGAHKARSDARTPRVMPDGRWQCAHTGCGHLNRPGASFCAGCGRPLRDPRDVDTYG